MEAIVNYNGGQYVVKDVKVSPMEHHDLQLQYTATGYGNKIPSRYMVKFNNRWRRVYHICFSNVSTEYIVVDGERCIVNLYV